jgi:hypothetical protein
MFSLYACKNNPKHLSVHLLVSSVGKEPGESSLSERTQTWLRAFALSISSTLLINTPLSTHYPRHSSPLSLHTQLSPHSSTMFRPNSIFDTPSPSPPRASSPSPSLFGSPQPQPANAYEAAEARTFFISPKDRVVYVPPRTTQTQPSRRRTLCLVHRLFLEPSLLRYQHSTLVQRLRQASRPIYVRLPPRHSHLHPDSGRVSPLVQVKLRRRSSCVIGCWVALTHSRLCDESVKRKLSVQVKLEGPLKLSLAVQQPVPVSLEVEQYLILAIPVALVSFQVYGLRLTRARLSLPRAHLPEAVCLEEVNVTPAGSTWKVCLRNMCSVVVLAEVAHYSVRPLETLRRRRSVTSVDPSRKLRSSPVCSAFPKSRTAWTRQISASLQTRPQSKYIPIYVSPSIQLTPSSQLRF